jgi:hypothetical protein
MHEDARFSVTFETDGKERAAGILKRFIARENEIRVVRSIGVRRINTGCAAAGKNGGNAARFERLRRSEAYIGERAFAGNHSGFPRRRGRVRRDSLTI